MEIGTMKQKIHALLSQAIASAVDAGELAPASPCVEIDVPRLEVHGDFSTNAAMVLAPIQKKAPRKIAEIIRKHINDAEGLVLKIDIAGPGFINFYIDPTAWLPVLKRIHQEGVRYGASDIGRGKKVQVEYVSSNPTGPLHIGHGRGAAVGDAVANILSFCGYDVQREYYINDSGRQIQMLGRSVFARYQELSGKSAEFPEQGYKGGYIIDIAKQIKNDIGFELAEKEESEAVAYCARYAAEHILKDMRQDLIDFGVVYDCWFSEQSLYDSGQVDSALSEFKEKNLIYEKDGALWFRTSDYGDEKDRVVVRQNGQTTYFASDIAYHQNKYQRGFDRVIDVWGADHHGYIQRLTASIMASGYAKEQFHVILVYMVNLLRGGVPVSMSTRAGEFVTLKDVVDEVGKDAARFIFLTRHYESPLDFDLEVAKKKSDENPVYYVQYVHARISSIFAKAQEKAVSGTDDSQSSISALTEPEDIRLIKTLSQYPEVAAGSAEFLEPHRITYYLMNLASAFHTYYNKHRVLTDDLRLTAARLYLIRAVQIVIHNGLTLLGVSAPDKM
jgi:arginyl-tRNA synthetase